VLATTLLAWAGRPRGAPYARAALGRWAALFGIAAGSAWCRRSPARQSLLEAVTAAAGVVSAVGLWQHLELPGLAIPVISAPGSTFGNRNLAAEAVALSLPLGRRGAGARSSRGRRLAIVAALALRWSTWPPPRARGLAGRRGGPGDRGAAGAAAAVARGRRRRRWRWRRRRRWAVLVPPPANERSASDPKRFGSAAAVVESSVDARSVALRTRLGLWRRTVALVREHPLTGVGPGNWPGPFSAPGRAGRNARRRAERDAGPAAGARRSAGAHRRDRAPGLAALLALGAGVVVTARRRLGGDRRVTAAAAGTLVASMGAGLTGFPLEMPATLALAGLALGLLAPEPGRAPSGRARVAAGGAGGRAGPVRGRARRGAPERQLPAGPGPSGRSTAIRVRRAPSWPWPSWPGWVPARGTTSAPSSRAPRPRSRLQRAAEAARWAEQAIAREPFSPNGWTILASAKLAGSDPAGARAAAGRALGAAGGRPAGAGHGRAGRAPAGRSERCARVDRDRLAARAAITTPGDRTTRP
jgi:hypothetical protein